MNCTYDRFLNKAHMELHEAEQAVREMSSGHSEAEGREKLGRLYDAQEALNNIRGKWEKLYSNK